MANDDIKHHWEQLYRDKSPLEVSWYQKEPGLSLRLIRNAGLDADDRIIDVGGGASLLVDRLLAAGYSNLAVLDIAANALMHARERLGEQAGRIEWYEEDVTCFQPPHEFALWHDRAVFHFLTGRAEQEAYVRVLERSLSPGGHLIIAAFAVGGPARCSGLDIVQYDATRLGETLGEGFRLVEETSESHVTPVGKI